jgi:hypothetical protein
MWRQGAGKHSKNDDDGGNELSLAAFEGQCFKCGKKGHRAAACKNPANSGGGGGAGGGNRNPRFNGTCNVCGKHGHMLHNCWEKDGNKGKRPKGWSSGEGETSNAAVDANSDVEMLLCHIDSYCSEYETVHSCKEWGQGLDVRDAHHQVPIRSDDVPRYLDNETDESDSDNLPPLKGRWDTTSGDDQESVFDDDDIWKDDDDDTSDDEIGEDVTLVDCGEDDYDYDDVALATMIFPNDMEMLRNENVWIADTATTVHTMSHEKGMKGEVKAEKDSITMDNGSN